MAITRTPHNTRIRFTRGSDSLQSFSRIRPNITLTNANNMRSAVNAIRVTDSAATGGVLTVLDELAEDNA